VRLEPQRSWDVNEPEQLLAMCWHVYEGDQGFVGG
jgi:catalase (peroxidase I)